MRFIIIFISIVFVIGALVYATRKVERYSDLTTNAVCYGINIGIYHGILSEREEEHDVNRIINNARREANSKLPWLNLPLEPEE